MVECGEKSESGKLKEKCHFFLTPPPSSSVFCLLTSLRAAPKIWTPGTAGRLLGPTHIWCSTINVVPIAWTSALFWLNLTVSSLSLQNPELQFVRTTNHVGKTTFYDMDIDVSRWGHVLYFPLQQLNTRCFSSIVFSYVISICFLKFGLIIFFPQKTCSYCLSRSKRQVWVKHWIENNNMETEWSS